MCVLKPCSQKVTQSVQCESRILGSRTTASITIACDSQTHTKTNGEWASHAGSMLLECFDSYADASVAIVLHQWLNQQTPKMVLEWDSDKTTLTISCKMIVSLESNVPVLGSHIALIQSPFAYKVQLWVSNALDTDRRLFFSLLYFRFRTSVSVLQHFPLAPFWNGLGMSLLLSHGQEFSN